MAMTLALCLTHHDWLDDVGGWHCEALKIPGARVDAVYAGGRRLDPGWYHVDQLMTVVRWNRDTSPPEEAVVAIVLEKELISQDVTVRWKKLAILMPLIAALVGLGGGVYVKRAATSHTKEYAISGTINLDQNGHRFNPEEIQLWVRPPDVIVNPDGTFTGRISIYNDSNNEPVRPDLLVSSGEKEYGVAVVHLVLNEEEKVLGTDYDVRVTGNRITVNRPVEFLPINNAGYDNLATQQTPRPIRSNR